jgi:hypothetical protein
MHLLLGTLAWLAASALTGVYLYDLAEKRGYEKGWKDAEEWIVKLESEVDAERVKIWREEG